jgi:hypothetical protein
LAELEHERTMLWRARAELEHDRLNFQEEKCVTPNGNLITPPRGACLSSLIEQES